jgi:RHS repeat-associated protein
VPRPVGPRRVGSTTYTYSNVSSKNRLDSYTDGTNTRHFTYTANGNMATDDRTFIGGGSVSNTFGGRDRLESQTVNSQSVTFTINAFGQRVSKAFSGTTTHFIHDILGNIIAEANGSTGTTTKEHVWMEGELLAQIDGSGNIVYSHNNKVGAPQKITDPSRTLVWDQVREPFGEVYSTPTNTTPTNHRFPGQYADAENSLSYNNARDYDTSIGRYIEADPLQLAAGPNLYGYAAQNPLQNIDPQGRFIFFLLAPSVGAAILDGSLWGGLIAFYAQHPKPGETSQATTPCDCSTQSQSQTQSQAADATSSDEMVTVQHFTNGANMGAIQRGGNVIWSGSYVTLPSETVGLNQSQVEQKLEINPGNGAWSSTFQVPKRCLGPAENGPKTSGQAVQYQLTTPAEAGTWVPTPK